MSTFESRATGALIGGAFVGGLAASFWLLDWHTPAPLLVVLPLTVLFCVALFFRSTEHEV